MELFCSGVLGGSATPEAPTAWRPMSGVVFLEDRSIGDDLKGDPTKTDSVRFR